MSALEKLLSSSEVDIGCEKPNLSCLESAYYKTHKYFTSEQLSQTITNNRHDIFVFVGEENDVKSILSTDHQQELISYEDVLTSKFKRFVYLRENEAEQKFQKLCCKIDCEGKPLIHLFIRNSERWVWTHTYNRQFYMERNFRPIIIDEKQLKEELIKNAPSLGFIIFSGTSEKILLDFLEVKENEQFDFKHNISIFFKDKDAQKEFVNITSSLNQKNKSIHWLKINEVENQKIFQWCRSHGDVSQLRRLVNTRTEETYLMNINGIKNFTLNETALLSETSLSKSAERLIIIAGEPGMGKTTTLTRMAELMMKQNPQMWVLKFDLKMLSASEQVNTLENFVNLLFTMDKKFDDPLTRCLLIYQLTCTEDVTLLLDGFDEIKSTEQDSILSLFEFIKNKTKAQIWITTRLHEQHKLEDRMSTLAYRFETLDEEDQENFLIRFWEMTLQLTARVDDKRFLEQFAKKVIGIFKQSTQTYRAQECIISIPLIAKMLAEIYQEKIEKAILENKHFCVCLVPEQLTLGSLYEQFIDRKYDIYLREKVNIGKGLDKTSKNILIQGYNEAYGKLALKGLFNPREIEHLINDEEEPIWLNDLSRIGFIQDNEKPGNFIHRTFAEYFAGKWLAVETKNSEWVKFIGVQLFRKEYWSVRRFIDYFLTQYLPFHKAILEKDLSTVAKLLKENFNINKKDILGRTVFHLLAEKETISIVCLPNECFKFSPDRFGKTALHYVAAFCDQSLRFHWLLKNFDKNLGKHIFEAPLHLTEEIGNSLFNKEECAKSKLVNFVNTQDEVGRTALNYAVDNENWCTAIDLLWHGANIKKLTTEQKRSLLLHCTKNFSFMLFLPTELFPIIGLSLIHITYDLCAEQGKIFENQQLQKKNPTFVFCYLIFFLLEYFNIAPINSLIRNVLDKNHCFQTSDRSNDLIILSSYINSVRSYTDKYILNEAKFLEIVRCFCEHSREIGIELLEEDRKQILNKAAFFGWFETFRYLFKFGENESDVFRSKNIIKCGVLTLRLFFSHLQNLNFDDDFLQNLSFATFNIFGWTRLHLVAMNKYVHSIDSFLNSDEEKNINREDGEGYTPLTTAVYSRNSTLVETFLNVLRARFLNDKNFLYEIIINKSTRFGQTALHFAVMNENVKEENYACAKVLLKNIKYIGFDKKQLFNIFSCRDKFDINPLGHVISRCSTITNGRREFLKLYLSYIQSSNFSSEQYIEILNGSPCLLFYLIYHNLEREAESLLKWEESLSLKDNKFGDFLSQEISGRLQGTTPLHLAAGSGFYEISLSLLKNGAIFNAYNDGKCVPLDFCVNSELLRIVINCDEKTLEGYDKSLFLLSSVNKLFELTSDEQTIHVSAKLDEIGKILDKIKLETWIEPESILNARNREGKTLLELSKHQEVTDLLRKLKNSVN